MNPQISIYELDVVTELREEIEHRPNFHRTRTIQSANCILYVEGDEIVIEVGKDKEFGIFETDKLPVLLDDVERQIDAIR